MQDFRNLRVWGKAHAPSLDIYRASKSLLRDEMYGMTSQMRRAVSIGANIAEGACARGDVDFARFVQITVGSASGLEYHLLLARDLDLPKASDYQRGGRGKKDAGISHAQGES